MCLFSIFFFRRHFFVLCSFYFLCKSIFFVFIALISHPLKILVLILYWLYTLLVCHSYSHKCILVPTVNFWYISLYSFGFNIYTLSFPFTCLRHCLILIFIHLNIAECNCSSSKKTKGNQEDPFCRCSENWCLVSDV